MSKDPIERRLQQTPDNLAPQRDLWPEISQRLQPASPRTAPWALAASLLLGVVLGGVGGVQLSQPATPSLQVEPLLMALQQQQQSERARLQARYTHSISNNADLALLQQASDEIAQALLAQPDNTALLEMLLWAQQREIEILEQQLRTSTPASRML
ncbi:hypothetical protein [Ferrimonas marina]|uniref:Uncharacterized protein n=1 Tax=Ferrimonas marina TaxID=299255 RepID=A0A1M5ZG14_9GAMM|nr:hypothetical protein [Ferrimonas marina]SHI23177.1 hypothetical protein SAMN02745129_0264 [Ferrimonas marina]